MLEQENGQMELDDWFQQAEEEGEFVEEETKSQAEAKTEQPVRRQREDLGDCPCAGSGPCQICFRGREHAREAGWVYLSGGGFRRIKDKK